MRTLQLAQDVELREIKKDPITVKELERLFELAGSYEMLFSRRAKLYKERGLKDEDLTEEDMRNFILEHYTFLNRPVLVYDEAIFIGNSSKTVESAKQHIQKNK